MLKKTCFIVEDKAEDKALLSSFIEKTNFLNLVGSASSYSETVSFLLTHPVDILFLDIEISDPQGLNGLDILKTVAKLPAVIITSNHDKFAVDSYTIGKTCDYLLKPLDFDRFLMAINRALSNHNTQNITLKDKSIFLKMGRSYRKFNLDEILYIESYGIYLKLFTDLTKKPFVVNESLVGILELLSNNGFIRVHKSFVINVMKISSFDANHIFIDTFPVPLGVSYKSKVDYLLKLFGNLDDR